MKTTTKFLVCLSIIFSLLLGNRLSAQVEVLTTNEVKLGDGITIAPDVNYVTGFDANYLYNTTGVRKIYKLKSRGTTGHRTGIVTNQSGTSGIVNGVENLVRTNSSIKFAVNNQLSNLADVEYGIFNSLNSFKNIDDEFSKTGVNNVIFENDAKFSWGFNNFITGGTESSITHGTQNRIFVNGAGDYYGSRNDITLEANANFVRGVAATISIPNGGATQNVGIAQAVYGEVGAGITGTGIWAGYFKGGSGVFIDGGTLQTSDRDLKEEIKEVKSALKDLKKLKPKTYKLKKDKGKGKTKHGFIAQDVQQIFPDLVQLVAQPGERRVEVIREEEIIRGEDGEEDIVIPEQTVIRQDMDGKPLLAMDYQGIIPIVVGAVQEQQVEIDNLKKKSNTSSRDNTDRILQLESELLETKDVLAQTNKKYDDLVSHIETLLKCVDCDGLRTSGDTGSIQFEDQFRLYPNPAKGSITVEALQKTSQSYQIAIMDNAGRVVLDRQQLTDGLTPVDVSTLSSGLYNVSIIEDGHVIATESLMIVNR